MKIKKLLPIIGIIIFIYIIYSIGFNKICTAFTNIDLNILYIFLILIFLILDFIFLAYKWQIIINLQGFKINFIEALKFYLMGNFYGFITPSRAGSLIRATYLKKKTERPLIECGSGIVIERAFDLFAILILATMGAIYIANHFAGLFLTTILILIGLLILGIFFASKRRAMIIFRLFHKLLIPNKFKNKAKDSFYIFYDSIPPIKNLIYPFILTILTWITSYTLFYIIALMFQVKIPYLIFIILVPISSLIGMIPITVSGLGTREATIVALLSIFNIPAEIALSISIMGVVIGGAIPALIGFLLTFKRK